MNKLSNNLQTISSKQLAMAYELRSTMGAADYKNYILRFMFHRYLSEKQELYFMDNKLLDVRNRETTSKVYLKEATETG